MSQYNGEWVDDKILSRNAASTDTSAHHPRGCFKEESARQTAVIFFTLLKVHYAVDIPVKLFLIPHLIFLVLLLILVFLSLL